MTKINKTKNTSNITYGTPGPCGYLYVNVGDEMVPVHQLIAETFLEPSPEGYDFAMHINGNITNNRAENLKWVDDETAKEFILKYLTNPFE